MSVDVRQLVMLIGAIARLSWDASEQRRHLAQLGVDPSADELALEFGDHAILAPHFEELGWLTPDEAAVIDRLSRRLEAMNLEGPEVWSWDVLSISTSWQNVRDIACSFFR